MTPQEILKNYLREHRLEPTEFAVGTGISIASLYRYLAGKKMHRSTAKKIHEATYGELDWEDLHPYE